MGMMMVVGKGGGVTYNGTMTQGETTDGSTFDLRGFNGTGSLSPTTMSDGNTISAWFDDTIGAYCSFSVTISPDPLQNGYVKQVTAHGTTKTMASASNYSYTAGNAQWRWNAQTFGFGISGTTACSSP